MLGAFPAWARTPAQAESLVAAIGRGRFMPGLAMLPESQREQIASLGLRVGAFRGAGGLAGQAARSQEFFSNAMTAANLAGTSPTIFGASLQGGMAALAGTGSLVSPSRIQQVIAPYFNSGLGPVQASSLAGQAVSGPLQAIGAANASPLRQYGMMLLSRRAASAGLASVIGARGLAALQATAGGKLLIAQWKASIKANGAEHPISTRLLQSIMQTSYGADPQAIRRDWKNIVGPALGINAMPGLGFLGQAWFLGESPQALAFGQGPGLPAGSLPANNPLNIRSGPSGFQQFKTIGAGFSAADKLLQVYASKYHLNTIAGIINRWAPPSENPTSTYIANVAKWTGWKPGQTLDMRDPATRAKLMAAMARQESGLKLTPQQVLADERLGTTFGANQLSASAPQSVINYGPKATGLALGGSEAMAAAGQGILAASDTILQALGSHSDALNSDTAVIKEHTDALKHLGDSWAAVSAALAKGPGRPLPKPHGASVPAWSIR